MKIILRYKGGSGSGYIGHEGRPGEVGGSTPSGNKPYTITYGSQANQLSSDPDISVLEKKIHDSSLSRDIRVQASNDRTAVQQAKQTKYKDGKTIKETIDKLITSGSNVIIHKGPRAYLKNKITGEEWTITSKTERDYADYVLNRYEK